MKVSQVHQAEIDIQVPFHDVDLMGVVWHGHYVKYFEVARCALLDSIDYNYRQMQASGYAWPVIDLHVRYPKSAIFAQKIVVRASVVEWENRFKIEYHVRDADTGQRMTRGHTVQVAVDLSNGEMCMESPAILYEKLGISV